MADTDKNSRDHQLKKNLSLLVRELKTGLEQIYHGQLRGVYLFGSFARGDQDSESDVDILVVLSHFRQYGNEIERTGELVSALSLKYDLTISRIFIRESDWRDIPTPLLRNVREEAIPV